MYSTLIPQIRTILDGVNRIKVVSSNPRTDFDMWPAAVIRPAGFENSFDSRTENFKMYRFDIDVMAGVSEQLTLDTIYSTTLPNAMDDVIQAFDDAWSAGTTTDGKKIWQKVDLGDIWQIEDESDGLTVVATLVLEIKLLTVNS